MININDYTEDEILICSGLNLTNVNSLIHDGIKYIDCSYNSIYQLDVPNSVEVLICNNNIINKIDLKYCYSLKHLNLENNLVEEIDLAEKEQLSFVNLNNNKLKKINLNTNNQLTEFYFQKNEIDYISFSEIPNILYLNCCENKIKHISLINNTSLIELKCDNNLIEELDLTGLNQIIYLSAKNNFIKDEVIGLVDFCSTIQYIDLSNNLLRKIECQNKKLQTLIVNQNKNLILINCAGNYIRKLNVNNLESLEVILCEDNCIEELYCSKCKLKILKFNNNNEIIINGNNVSKSSKPSLNKIYCDYNQLEYLDLSYDKNLTDLNCSNNKLISLNVFSVVEMDKIECSFNKISNLDLSNVLNRSIFASNNLIKNIKINNFIKNIDFSNNFIKNIDFVNFKEINYLNLSNNLLNRLEIIGGDDIEINLKSNNIGYLCLNNCKNINKIMYNIKIEFTNTLELKNIEDSFFYYGDIFNKAKNIVINSCNFYDDLVFFGYDFQSLYINKCNSTKITIGKCNLSSLFISNCNNLKKIQCNENRVVNVTLKDNELLENIDFKNNFLDIFKFYLNEKIKEINLSNNFIKQDDFVKFLKYILNFSGLEDKKLILNKNICPPYYNIPEELIETVSNSCWKIFLN